MATPASKKRTADEISSGDETVTQQSEVGLDDDAPASLTPVAKKVKLAAPSSPTAIKIKTTTLQGVAAPLTPTAIQQKQVRSKYVFYPDMYDTFDPAKIAFAKDPQASRDGSGEILFLSYLFEDGMQPLMIQTPNAMHSPTGVTVWKDGKCSILLSAGREWENQPLMVKFKQIMDTIQMRCVEIVCEKGWNKGGSQNPEIVQESFSTLMFIGEDKETGSPYPPSVKGTITIDGPSKTELFEKVVNDDGSVVMNCLIPTDVSKGCGVTGILHLPWIFRKKAKKGFNFSIRSNLFQGRVFAPSVPGGFTRGGCAVYD